MTIERSVEYLESRADSYLFDRKEVCVLLGLSMRTIVRYAELGLLKETRLPSARGARSYPRYTRAAIEAFRNSGYTRRRT